MMDKIAWFKIVLEAVGILVSWGIEKLTSKERRGNMFF